MSKHRLTTYQNARTYLDEHGRRRMVREDMQELVKMNTVEDAELMDWLEDKQ